MGTDAHSYDDNDDEDTYVKMDYKERVSLPHPHLSPSSCHPHLSLSPP